MRFLVSRYCFVLFIVLAAAGRPALAGDASDLLRLGIQSLIIQQQQQQRQDDAVRSRRPAQVQPQTPRRQTTQPARPARDEDTALVQRKLNQLGYDAGPVDGQFGRRTRAAILAYERDRGLAPTGRPSQQLIDMLRHAQPAPQVPAVPAGGGIGGGYGNSLAAFRMLNGYDLPASDYRSGSSDPRLRGIMLDACAGQCQADPACRAFTYNQPMRVCILKSGQPAPSLYPGAISGLKIAPTGAATAHLQPPGALPPGGAAPGSARPTPAGLPAEPAPLPPFALQEPLRNLAPVRQGNRLLTGYPITYGDQIGPDLRIDRRSHAKSSFDLAYLADLMIAKARPEVFSRPEVALTYAERYLIGPKRDQLFAGCQGNCSPNTPYDGWAGTNEFERADAYRAFVAQIVPRLQSAAPAGPIGLLSLSEVELQPYDQETGAFPIHPLRGTAGLFGYVRPASAPQYAIEGEPPQSLPVAPHAAPALLAHIPNDKRRAFLATYQTLAEPEWDFALERPLLSVRNEGYALFADAAMTTRLHVFSTAPAPEPAPIPAATLPEIEVTLTPEMLVARYAPSLLSEDAMQRAVEALITTDQRLYASPKPDQHPFFRREEVEGRVAQFAVNELLPGFRDRLAERLATLPSRLSVTTSVALQHLIYEDGALRRDVQSWHFKALTVPLNRSSQSRQDSSQEAALLYDLPKTLKARAQAHQMPKNLTPAFQQMRRDARIGLILDFHPVIPPLPMPSREAEALYKRPECEMNVNVYRQSGMTAGEAVAQVEACMTMQSQYKPELGITLDLEITGASTAGGVQPGLMAKVLGASVTGPTGNVLRRFTPEELGAVEAQRAAAEARQAAPAEAAPTVDIAPTAALVHVGAKLMDTDPLSVMEGIIGWRGDRTMNVFDKRDLAQRLVSESQSRAGDDGYWVEGSIVWDSYDFATEHFPVKSLDLTVMAPLHETVRQGVALRAINAEAFALPMPPDAARAFTQTHGDPIKLPVRARVVPRKAGTSSGALYLQSEVLDLEVLTADAEARRAGAQDVLHRWQGAAEPAQVQPQTAALTAPAEPRPTDAPADPAAESPAYDLAGVTLGMGFAEAERILRSKIDVANVSPSAPQDDSAPFGDYTSFTSADGNQQFVLFTDPAEANRIVAVGRSIYVPAKGGETALRASLVDKYGPPLAGVDRGPMIWTTAVNAPPHVQAPPAVKYRLGSCQIAFGGVVAGQRSGANGAAARGLSVMSGRGKDDAGRDTYDTEIWRACAPLVLAEIRETPSGARLDYALVSLPDYAATWSARQEKAAAEAQRVAIPDL